MATSAPDPEAPFHPLFLNSRERSAALGQTCRLIEHYLNTVDSLPVESIPSAFDLNGAVSRFDFNHPMRPDEAIRHVAETMTSMQTHTAHARYFGLFNPAPSVMGIAGDALAAAFNTQLAAWTHAPFAVRTEQHLIRSLGSRFGGAFTSGAFTSGGAEANLTAILCALLSHFPTFSRGGLRSLPKQPIVYASAAAHHSLVKAVRVLGLGTEALHVVPCDETLGMDPRAFARMLTEDRSAGLEPLMVAVTAGATATGIVERIRDIGTIAKAHGLWTHVDAAWGGFAAFVPELAEVLDGIEETDSITFDPHKMLSVPMGAGLFLTRHRDVLGRAFTVSADYMPASADDNHADPFTHSFQWSRRFIGLKLLLSLAVAGWEGYANVLRQQTALGDALRRALIRSGWRIVNDTKLPVVCFVPRSRDETPAQIASEVQRGGRAWISAAVLPDGTPVLRACITNYRSTEDDVKSFVDDLGRG